MKRFLATLLVGLVGGFAAGVYTPLGDMAGQMTSLDAVKSILASDEASDSGDAGDGEDETVQSTLIEKIGGAVDLVKEVGSEAKGSFTTVQKVMQVSKPTEWVMAYEDVSQAENPIAQAAMTDGDGSAAVSQEAQEMINFLEETKTYLLAENESLTAQIAQIDPSHPESPFMKILVESNLAMVSYMDHLIDLQKGKISIESLAALQVVLDTSNEKVQALAQEGHRSTASWSALNTIMPAKSDEERVVKALVDSLFKTYTSSFQNEQAIGNKLVEYPALLAIEIASAGDGSLIEKWGGELEVMANKRMEIQESRAQVAAQIIMSAPSS